MTEERKHDGRVGKPKRRKHRIRRIAGWLAAFVAVVFLLPSLLYIPAVQRVVKDFVAEKVSEATGYDVSVGRFALKFPFRVAVDDLTVLDEHKDTLVSGRTLALNVRLLPLLTGNVDISGLEVGGAGYRMVSADSSLLLSARVERFELRRGRVDLLAEHVDLSEAVVDGADVALSMDVRKEKPEPPDTASAPSWLISLGKLELRNVACRMSMMPSVDSLGVTLPTGRIGGLSVNLAANVIKADHVETNGLDAAYLSPSERELNAFLADYTPADTVAAQDSAKPWTVVVNRFRFNEGRGLYATRGLRPSSGFDAGYLRVDSVNLAVDDFYTHGSIIRIPLVDLSARERSGLAVRKASGLLTMDEKLIAAKGVSLETDESALSLEAEASSAILEGSDDARLSVKLASTVSFAEVGRAMPVVKPLLGGLGSRTANFALDVSGTLRRLQVERVGLDVPGVVSVGVKGTAGDVVSPDKVYGKLALDGKLTGGRYLKRMLGLDGSVDIPVVSLKGTADYRNSALEADFTAHTGKGQIVADGKWGMKGERYRAAVDFRHFDVRSVLPEGGAGLLDGKISVSGEGYDPYRMAAHLEAEISSVVYGGVTYQDLFADARLENGEVEATLRSGSDFAKLDLSAQGRIAPGDYRMRFAGRIDNVDLVAMGMSEERLSGGMNVSGGLVANLAEERYGGVMRLSDIFVLLPENTFRTDSIDFGFHSTAERSGFRVRNNDLKLEMRTRMGAAAFVDSLMRFMPEVDSMLVAQRLDAGKIRAGLPRFTASLESGKRNIVHTYLSGMGTAYDSLHMKVEKAGDLRVETKLAHLSVGGMTLEEVGAEGRTEDDKLRYSLHVDNGPLYDEFVKMADLSGFVSGNQLDAYLRQTDRDDRVGFDAGVRMSVADSVVTASFYPERPTIAFLEWQVNRGNYMSYDLASGKVRADVEIRSGQRSLIAVYTDRDGQFHNGANVDLSGIDLKDWLVMSPFAPPVEGDLSAKLRVNYNDKYLWGSGDVDIAKLRYGKKPVGNLCIDAKLAMAGDQQKLYATAGMKLDGHQFLSVKGYRSDSLPEPVYNLDLTVDRLPMSAANAFLPDAAGQLSGYLNGKMKMTGGMVSPQLDGYLQMDSAKMLLPAFGMSMAFDDRHIPVEGGEVKFESFGLRGENSNPLTIDGVFRLTPVDKMYADLRVKGKEVQIVNGKKTSRSELYGKAFINMNTTVKGYVDQLDVKATVSVLAGSNLTYVYQSAAMSLTEAAGDDVVEFVRLGDTAAAVADTLQVQPFSMRVKAALIVQPNAIFTVNLSPDGKNKVQINGEGMLSFSQNDQGDMSLIGRYTISDGYVRYSPPMMSEKLFNFKEGSSISWTGNLLNPAIDISAVQSMKVNVGGGNQGSRVVPFDVWLNVGNTLSSLNVGFDLSTDGDMTIANELSGMTAEQRSTQAMNLLLYGTYTGGGTTTIDSGSLSGNMAYSFLESVVNRWAANTISGVDLSFGIDQYDKTVDGNTSTTTSYSYQVSKSVFDDRFKIVVGGNYATDASAEDNLAQNLVNDISFEYKLNKTGTTYVKLFHHKEYESILEGEITETGGGFVWKRKINSLRDMFRFLKPRKSVAADSENDIPQ